MGQRLDRHQHAARRKRTETNGVSPKDDQGAGERRAPLAGYETLYEITRAGRLYSLESHAYLAPGYAHSPFVRFTAHGKLVSLPKQRAITDSWRDHQPKSEA
jgi:hypothetical protein